MWLGFFTVSGTFWAVRASLANNKNARRLTEIEIDPFVTIVPVEASQVRWNRAKGFVSREMDFEKKTAVFCKIESSGRAPVVFTGITRNWTVAKRGASPATILAKAYDNTKRFQIPVGPNGIIIAADSEPATAGLAGDVLFFHGVLEYTNIDGSKRFRSGFCFTLDSAVATRGLVTALPGSDSSDLWYRCRVA